MALYAIIDNDHVVGFRNLDVVPTFDGPKAQYRRILPVVDINPPYNPLKEKKSEGPTWPDPVPVDATELTRTWIVTPLNETEVDNLVDQISASFSDIALFEFGYYLLDQIQQIKGQPTPTRQQVIDQLKIRVKDRITA